MLFGLTLRVLALIANVVFFAISSIMIYQTGLPNPAEEGILIASVLSMCLIAPGLAIAGLINSLPLR